jgi:hypothetical protein
VTPNILCLISEYFVVYIQKSMEGVLAKLSPGLPWQKLHLTKKESFYQQIGLKFEEETSEMLHLVRGFVWC